MTHHTPPARRSDGGSSLPTLAVIFGLLVLAVLGLAWWGSHDHVNDTAAVMQMPADPTEMRNEAVPTVGDTTPPGQAPSQAVLNPPPTGPLNPPVTTGSTAAAPGAPAPEPLQPAPVKPAPVAPAPAAPATPGTP